jgi:hypothetical protein
MSMLCAACDRVPASLGKAYCEQCELCIKEPPPGPIPEPPPPRRNNNVNHSALIASIRLDLGQEPDLTMWPVQPGGIPDGSGRPMRCGPPGMSDLIAILAPTGRWFCIEGKTGKGQQRPDQVLWGDLIRKRGGFYAVVRSVEDARAALARARRGECK